MISIIVALAKNGVIGKGGELPWKLSADLKHFASLTRGHTVIMGRKTYESIVGRLGHALPDRQNIVITSQKYYSAPGCMIISSVAEAIKNFSVSQGEIFVIGGGEIYRQFMPAIVKLYVTEVDTECNGDTFFPSYLKEDWELISSERHEKDEKNSYGFTFLEMLRK